MLMKQASFHLLAPDALSAGQAGNVVSPTPLYTVSQVEAQRQKLPILAEIVDWMRHFLAKPHPDLGRPGAVCPYVEYSMKIDTIWLTTVPMKVPNREEIERIVLQFCDVFLNLEPKQGRNIINKAILIAFPDVPMERAPELIDTVQSALKPHYTASGLMLGEFHEHNQTPGLRNENFYPLRSPIPMLVIRHMAESDLPFLTRHLDSPERRINFLKAYLRRLGSDISEKQMDEMLHELVKASLQEKGAAYYLETA